MIESWSFYTNKASKSNDFEYYPHPTRTYIFHPLHAWNVVKITGSHATYRLYIHLHSLFLCRKYFLSKHTISPLVSALRMIFCWCRRCTITCLYSYFAICKKVFKNCIYNRRRCFIDREIAEKEILFQ